MFGGVQWSKVAIVGVGLLGGSLGLAIKRRGLASQVIGYVRRASSAAACKEAGAVDGIEVDLAAAVQSADLIILCTPIAQMRPLVETMLPALARGALVTDVGSVKGSVVRELEPLVSHTGAEFIGSHPMAGGEKMGVAAARHDLFVDAICAITPTRRSSPESVQRLEQFWAAIGGIPMRLSPELHDELVSRSSHLPHVLAAQLAKLVLSPDHPQEQSQLCGNGFKDTTRIASGSPEMWRDICLANRQNLGRALGIMIERLQEFRRALDNQDIEAIEALFTEAKKYRDAWKIRGASTSTE